MQKKKSDVQREFANLKSLSEDEDDQEDNYSDDEEFWSIFTQN